MARIRRDEKLLSFKILYVGAAQSGKSTTLGQLHAGLTPTTRGDLTTSAVTSEATLFFDVKVPDADILPGYASALQVFTVPGEVKYRATLCLLLEGADGIVFVVDSEASRHAENLRAWQQLQGAMADMELSFADVPLVFQYNKADLPTAVGREALDGFLQCRPQCATRRFRLMPCTGSRWRRYSLRCLRQRLLDSMSGCSLHRK